MRKVFLGLAGLAIAGLASAQDEDTENGWSGEGALSAGITTGNTDTLDLGLSLNVTRLAGPWKFNATGSYDYGRIDGETSKNRFSIAGQADRNFTERLYAFGRVSYEQDDFSGFESRLFVGVGGGYHVFKRDNLRWDLEAAPGVRIDKVADTVIIGPPEVVVPGETETNFGARGASNFGYDINERVTFTNNTGVVWSPESTQLINTTALDAGLTEAITARISFEVRHDTNPPAGFEATDTATRLSIVYGF